MVLKDIFLTGGSGTLGTELIKKSDDFNIRFVAPTTDMCDITKFDEVIKSIGSFKGKIVLHAAAMTNVKQIESNPMKSIEVNVCGTINIIKACQELNKKLVFVSTDYVFDGEKGNYKTNDPINPISKYAKTKAAAELLVRTVDNSLIIRTSFFGYSFPYDKAAFDQWSTKDYVDIIAPMVLKEAKSNKTGIVHVGTDRSSTFEKASRRKVNVEKVSLGDINFKIPRDVSLYLGD